MQNVKLAIAAAEEQICYSSASARNALLHVVTDPWCGLCKPTPQLRVPGCAAACSLHSAGPGAVVLALLLAALRC